MARTDRRARRRLAAAVVVGLAIAIFVALLPGSGPVRLPVGAPAGESRAGLVTCVYDGDTIEVRGVGKVRLIGIDAPDGYNEERMTAQALRHGMSLSTVGQWAGRATEFARRTLDERSVHLEYGPELKDDYGRALAYVRLDAAGLDQTGEEAAEQDFNLLMLQKGLAAAYRSARHPRRDEYLAAEAQARRARLGLWQDAKAQP